MSPNELCVLLKGQSHCRLGIAVAIASIVINCVTNLLFSAVWYLFTMIMAALCNRQGIISLPWFLSSLFFFLLLFTSFNLSGRRLDVYHTSLVRI